MNQEKLSSLVQLAGAPVTLLVFLFLISPNFGLPLSQFEYGWPIFWSVISGIVTGIAVAILISIIFRDDLKRTIKDERDIKIQRYGDLFAHQFYIAGGVAALILAIFEIEHVLIAIVIFITFTLGSLVASSAKLVMYRYGVN